jgi:hypothetical protein
MSARATAMDWVAAHRLTVRRRVARLVTLIVIVAAHMVAFVLFPALRSPLTQAPPGDTSTIAFFLPLDQPRETAQFAKTRQTASKRPPAHQHAPIAAPLEVPAASPESSSAPIAIDWAKEAENVATRRIEADEEVALKASALSRRRGQIDNLAAAPRRTSEFGWDHARTHRVEPIPGGGMLVNLNDRCAIVVTIMLMPVCRVGTLKSRGDLFQHMDDPPELGDWRHH